MMQQPETKQSDPGVPEALPRSLIRLRDRLGVEAIDRLWIFPPSRKGRREQGLVAVSTYLDGEIRREMVTVAYTAEHTGTGTTVETSLTREGEAPPERFPGVMTGVSRRSGDGPEAREVVVDGSAEAYEELLREFDLDFLEAPAP